MKQLKTLIEQPDKRQAVVRDCVDLVEAEVRKKGGLTGIVIKTAFAVVKAVKPGVIAELVDGLLDNFVDRVEPFYVKYQEAGESGALRDYLGAQSSDVAESLLGVTDQRAQNARNRTILKAYQKLRPKAKAHVVAAVPGVGSVLDRHVPGLE